jgi:hypothetical protein
MVVGFDGDVFAAFGVCLGPRVAGISSSSDLHDLCIFRRPRPRSVETRRMPSATALTPSVTVQPSCHAWTLNPRR